MSDTRIGLLQGLAFGLFDALLGIPRGRLTGTLKPGAASFRAGRLGTVVVVKEEIRLGRCHIVTKGNIESFG